VTATDIMVVFPIKHYEGRIESNSINSNQSEEISLSEDSYSSRYLSVSDLAIGGRCKCNGHASKCNFDKYGELTCDCQHNTMRELHAATAKKPPGKSTCENIAARIMFYWSQLAGKSDLLESGWNFAQTWIRHSEGPTKLENCSKVVLSSFGSKKKILIAAAQKFVLDPLTLFWARTRQKGEQLLFRRKVWCWSGRKSGDAEWRGSREDRGNTVRKFENY